MRISQMNVFSSWFWRRPADRVTARTGGTQVVEAEELGSRILKNRDEMISGLVTDLRAQIPILKNDSRTYLIDHLPLVLEHIGAFLRSHGSRSEILESARLGDKHGEQRAFHSNYTVSDIRKEYNLLRGRILDLVSTDEVLSKLAFELLSKVLEASVSHATEEFVRNSFSEIRERGLEKRQAAAELQEARDTTAGEKAARMRERANITKLFADSPQFFTILSGPEFTFEYCNAAHIKMFHGQDFTGKTLAEARPELIGTNFHKALQRVFTLGQSEVMRDAHVTFQGRAHYFDLIFAPRYGADGLIDAVFALGTDTTAQIEATKTAENARREFKEFFMQAPAPMCVMMGPDHVFTIANPLYTEFIGRDPRGKPLREVFSNEEGGALFEILDEVYTSGRPHIGKELPFKKTIGSKVEHFRLNVAYHPFRDSDGIVRGIFAFVQDVTEQVQGREAAENQQRWLEEVLNRLPKPLFFFDPKTAKSTFSNAAADRLMGTKYEGNRPVDIYGESIVAYHVDGRRMSQDEIPSSRTIRGENLNGDEILLQTPAGGFHLRAFSEHMPAAFGHDETSVLLIQDITQLKAAENEAKNANAAKSQFLANMSHEIRTPLGAIMGFVSLLKDDTLNRRDLENFLSVIERNSAQLLRIIDDILDLSKVEAGMMLIEHIEFSLPELMTDFSSLLGFKAREKGIGFFSRAVTPLPKLVNTDPTRLRQILMNVVGNAVKFTDRGKVELQVAYRDGFLEFTVTDTGRGISPDQEKNLFQPFSQADTSTTRKYGGTGLGLVLTRSLSEALGGSFELRESVLDKGSTFVIRIKVEVADGTEFVSGLGFTTETVRTVPIPGRLQNIRVLLVEDSPDNQALISIFLVRAGAHVDIASDGEQGCEKALQENYDVVLMDVQMPIMDGITAIERLRNAGYTTPVVALTAHAMKEERIRCLAAGFTEFLSKPVSREELIRVLIALKTQPVTLKPQSQPS